MSHTPTPWPKFTDIFEPATPHPDSEPVARLSWDDYNRARACVNALQSTSTEDLEAAAEAGITDITVGNLFSSRLKLQRELVEVKAQREQLLTALERWIVFGKAMQKTGSDLPRHLIADTQAAINAVKGK